MVFLGTVFGVLLMIGVIAGCVWIARRSTR
jgi:hypothetical protein